MTRFFFDTEFIEDGKTIDLLSIGVVAEDGTEFYRENGEADLSRAAPWVQTNVLPYLHGRGVRRWRIASDLIKFVNADDDPPEFWAYYADYDWVVLCQLFGTMVDLPAGWPMFCMDLKQLAVSLGDPPLPAQTSTEHHALADARWVRDTYLHLTTRETTR